MKTLVRTVFVALILLMVYLPTNAQMSWLRPVVSLKGTISDKIDSEPVGLKIYVLDKENKKIAEFNSDELDGSFFITGLKGNEDYILSFNSEDFVKKTIKIHTPNIDFYKEIAMDIYVKPKVEKEELQSQKI